MASAIDIEQVSKSFSDGNRQFEVLRHADLHVEQGEFVAIDRALERLQPGDLSLILIDQVDEALAHIAKRVKEG